MMQYKFIDLFSGCGGLSLGFSMAGLEGQFAVEKDAMAFDTFSENFLGNRKIPVAKFSWPSWLKQRAWAIDELLAEHRDQLLELQGTVQVLAGGPPCQGFSFAGKRKEADPRNMLFEKYVQVVDAVKPSALVLENVPGMKVAHKNKPSEGEEPEQASESYYEKLKRSLEAIGYDVHGQIVDASRFGVPQKRSRLIVIGLRRHLSVELKGGIGRAFEILEATRVLQLEELGLLEVTTAMDAISDLRTSRSIRRPCIDQYSPPGFEEAEYLGPGTVFQKLMHKNCRNDSMDSMRLAKHRADVQERFQKILDECPMGQDDRSKNMLVAIMLNMFYENMLKTPKRPFVGTSPQLRVIDSYLLVDEADNIMRYEFDVLRKLLLQGREFGAGVILASQYLRHFKTSATDYREPLLTWFIHKVPNATPAELGALGLTSDLGELSDRVKTLPNHHCLYKSFDVAGEVIRGLPFYELEKQAPDNP